MENNVFEIFNENSTKRLILTCEHASADIPYEYDNLGLSAVSLDTHIARDKGCYALTRKLAEKLGCFAVAGKYSRLLIDLNRNEDEQELIVAESDQTLIPGNQNLSAEEREKRILQYYRPYYAAVEKQLDALTACQIKPVIFSVHSFTPQLKGGAFRPWQAGILFHRPQPMASFVFSSLKQKTNKVVAQNVPYDLRRYDTGTAVHFAKMYGLDYALIEIRDDEFADIEKGSTEWAEILSPILAEYAGCQFKKSAVPSDKL